MSYEVPPEVKKTIAKNVSKTFRVVPSGPRFAAVSRLIGRAVPVVGTAVTVVPMVVGPVKLVASNYAGKLTELHAKGLELIGACMDDRAIAERYAEFIRSWRPRGRHHGARPRNVYSPS